MYRSRVESLHVVEGDWRINQEAENPGADEIPECDGDEAVDWPLIGLDPLGGATEIKIVVSLKTHQDQRHDLKSAEGCPERHHRRWRTGEIQMVKSPDDPSKKKDIGREQDSYRRRARSEKSHTNEQKCHHHCGEDFEEPFNPQVDDPPPPILDNRQVCLPPPQQTGSIKQRNCRRGDQEKSQ